jgi:hypothetical protein
MKIIFVRQEDYWIFPLSFFGVVFTTVFLYAGAMKLRLVSGLIGLSIFYFMMYIIRKNYTKHLAHRYILICLVVSVVTAFSVHLLTN